MTCFELSVSTWDTEALGRDHLSGTLRMNDVMKAGVSLQEFKLDRPSKARAGASDVRGSQDVPQAYALFQQPWWLDAVAPGAWDEVRVERDGQILARLPFMIKRRFGLTALTRPSLTWFLGPWFSSGDSKGATLLRQQKELTLDLISQLPRYDVCRMTLAPQVTNWLPFHWAGFSAIPYCTYRIPDLSDEDALWAEMDSFARTAIRKAAKKVVVRTDLGIDAVLDLQERTYARHGWAIPDRDAIYRLHEACTARRCCQSFVAEDAQGRRHKFTHIVWDDRCAYAFAGGMDHELSRSGAPMLVRWEAIRFASKVTKSFDFCGSRAEPVERVFRGFGARQITCFAVSKFSRRMRVLNAARELAAAVTGRGGRPVQYARIAREGTLKGRFALLANEIRRVRSRPAA